MLIDVVHVTVKPDFQLLLEFKNGEHRRFNMGLYIDQKPWVKLKADNSFSAAFVENGTVTWPGNIDIDPETLYDYSHPLQQKGHPL